MDYLKKARAVIDLEISALNDLKKRLGISFTNTVKQMLQSLQKGNKIIATGIGKSGHIAEKIAATLTSTGAPCIYLNCVNALHGDLGILSEGDTLLIFSYSGETQEVLQALPALARHRIQMIAMTGNAKSH
ncbi:MAG: SIS domain-containing protein [Verrucomicrobiia bacterium]